MDTKTKKIKDFELYYQANKDSLVGSMDDVMKIISEYDNLYYNLFADFSDELKPLLLQLMFRHYPDFKTLTNADCIQYLDRAINNHIYTQIVHMYNLCRFNQQHSNLGEKYADLEKYRGYKFNSLHLPDEQDEWHEYFTIPGEDYEWESPDMNNLRYFYNEMKQKRRNEYCQIMEPLLHYHMPELKSLEGDYAIMYIIHRDVNYKLLDSAYKRLEATLDYEMPLESIALNNADWKLLQQNYLHNGQKVFAKRTVRVYCENKV